MNDKDKTKTQLLQELSELHQQNIEFKRLEIDRMKAENALRKLEEMYKILVKTSQEAVALHDIDTKIIEVSDRWLKLWGYSNANEVIGKNGFDFIHAKDHEKAVMDRENAFKKGFLENLEYTFIRKDGTNFIGELNGTLIKDDQGNPKGFLATTRDITERKKMEEKLKRYSKELEMMVKERTRELKKTQEEVKTLRRHIQQSRRYPEIIGNSPKILQLIDLIHQIAPTDSTVLISGETGSGKDLIALAIHYNSSRKEAPFIDVNCAALPEHLIESELFGYVKGAFTGATQNKMGFFEAANKGTIHLNEIGDLPLQLQGKLLQVLEKRQIYRLGESKSFNVDTRIIAATNKDLKEAVKKGTFREDLFYRLNVFPIYVPPLRERKEDIPLLAKHILNKYCSFMNRQISNISREALDILCSYSYPGNVRELENIIQRSVIIAQGSTLLPLHLPEELKRIEFPIQPNSLLESLAQMEKQSIEAALQDCEGNLSRAAKKLGINRTTLWRRIKKFDIDISLYVHG